MPQNFVLVIILAFSAWSAPASAVFPENGSVDYLPPARLLAETPHIVPQIAPGTDILLDADAPCSLNFGTQFRFDEEPDPVAFHTATFARPRAGRQYFSCQAPRPVPEERIITLEQGTARQCYFAALPQLRLDDSGADRGFAPRIILTVRSLENPQAELELMLTRSPDGNDWSEPGVAFMLASPGLRQLGVEEADIRLDAAFVPSDLALVMFGDTRLRVMMDPYRKNGKSPDAFFSRLAGSDRATLRLLDIENRPLAVLRFDVGPVLEAAKEMLARTDWSCGKTTPAPRFAMR